MLISLRFGADALARGDDCVSTVHRALTALPALRAHDAELFTIIAELMTNAVDYGVLRLDGALKDTPEGFAAFYETRERALRELTVGWVRAELTVHDGDEMVMILRVSDSGGATVSRPRPAASESCHGRGLELVRALCDELRLLPGGRGVEVVKRVARRIAVQPRLG